MDVKKALRQLRISFLDDTGGIGVDWINITENDPELIQLRWSNEELISFIDIAQKAVARDTGCWQATRTLGVRAGAFEARYDAGAGYEYSYGLLRAILGREKKVLKIISMEEYMDDYYDDVVFNTNRVGVPYIIAESPAESLFRVYPRVVVYTPIMVTRYQVPADLQFTPTYLSQLLIIPPETQPYMLYYAAAMAYNKEGPRTFDPQKSVYYLNMYREYFGIRNFYLQKQRSRTGRRTIKYGGY